ncbi:hypothetical protein N1031_02135 [Herbiconiux moechotypicola]|uniref:Protein kinase domain-containing protein n=1 Tax=Herbiconiux moechotypicola TaxID=637393 RepID=A0ABN3D6R2_9MICO|nr:hypothetical protein [Herbiconiux moechotypicola]MCS5728550.1 hypothetical protein [Herbiconiux moechotypicola]
MRMRGTTIIDGVRLVELLSVGPTANVFVGVSTRSGAWGAAGARVVVKLRARGDNRAHSEPVAGEARESRALEAHPIGAMPRLWAKGFARGQDYLVMSECPGMVVPLAGGRAADRLRQVVGELHAAGWAHGGLGESGVLIDDDGSVSLIGFSRARCRGDPGFARASLRDLHYLAGLPHGDAASRGEVATVSIGEAEASRSGEGDAAVAGARGISVASAEWKGDAGDEWAEFEQREVREAVVVAPRIGEAIDPALEAVRVVGEWARDALGRRRRRWFTPPRRKRIVVAAVVVVLVVVVASVILP